jgi:hypothetical protein
MSTAIVIDSSARVAVDECGATKSSTLAAKPLALIVTHPSCGALP